MRWALKVEHEEVGNCLVSGEIRGMVVEVGCLMLCALQEAFWYKKTEGAQSCRMSADESRTTGMKFSSETLHWNDHLLIREAIPWLKLWLGALPW